MTYIDMTPTWEGILPLLLTLLENANAEGKHTAKTELMKMAKLADAYNESNIGKVNLQVQS